MQCGRAGPTFSPSRAVVASRCRKPASLSTASQPAERASSAGLTVRRRAGSSGKSTPCLVMAGDEPAKPADEAKDAEAAPQPQTQSLYPKFMYDSRDTPEGEQEKTLPPDELRRLALPRVRTSTLSRSFALRPRRREQGKARGAPGARIRSKRPRGRAEGLGRGPGTPGRRAPRRGATAGNSRRAFPARPASRRRPARGANPPYAPASKPAHL